MTMPPSVNVCVLGYGWNDWVVDDATSVCQVLLDTPRRGKRLANFSMLVLDIMLPDVDGWADAYNTPRTPRAISVMDQDPADYELRSYRPVLRAGCRAVHLVPDGHSGAGNPRRYADALDRASESADFLMRLTKAPSRTRRGF